MALVFPHNWEVEENPEVAELLNLKNQDFAFLKKSSTLAVEAERYAARPLAFRRIKAAFQAVFYMVAVRRQAFETQKALATSGRAEFEDALDMYGPVLTSWFSALFANYMRSVLNDATAEKFLFDASPENPSLPVFRIRFSVFLKLLFSSSEPPTALLSFWPRLTGPRIYIPEAVSGLCGSALPAPDAHGARNIGVFSGEQETLAGLIVVFKSLIENVLLKKYSSLMKQRDSVGSSLSRAASHFRLLASLLAYLFVEEFVPADKDKLWSPQLLPFEDTKTVLETLRKVRPVQPLTSPRLQDSVMSPDSSGQPWSSKKKAKLSEFWASRTGDEEIAEPIISAGLCMRRWLAGLLRTPMTTRRTQSVSGTTESSATTIFGEEKGTGEWVVIERDGAEVYAEPTKFNAPIERLSLGRIFNVVEVARSNTWLQTEQGGWVYGRTAFTGEPTVARMLKLETETDVFMVRAKTPLYSAPYMHKGLLKGGEKLEKFAVVTVLDTYRVEHSSVFGVKFLRLPQGWIPDKLKASASSADVTTAPAMVKERSDDGNILFKNCTFQTIRPWSAPDWKSKKMVDVEIASDASFQVDLVIKTDDGAEWVRMKTEGFWLPIKHAKLPVRVICKASESASELKS